MKLFAFLLIGMAGILPALSIASNMEIIPVPDSLQQTIHNPETQDAFDKLMEIYPQLEQNIQKYINTLDTEEEKKVFEENIRTVVYILSQMKNRELQTRIHVMKSHLARLLEPQQIHVEFIMEIEEESPEEKSWIDNISNPLWWYNLFSPSGKEDTDLTVPAQNNQFFNIHWNQF